VEHIVSLYQTKYQAATGWSDVPILEWATPSLTVWLRYSPLKCTVTLKTWLLVAQSHCKWDRCGVDRIWFRKQVS